MCNSVLNKCLLTSSTGTITVIVQEATAVRQKVLDICKHKELAR